jgi:hypothetical protein
VGGKAVIVGTGEPKASGLPTEFVCKDYNSLCLFVSSFKFMGEKV